MEKSSYNPDVLNCLANLSNDEVFTPPALATQMIDLLPAELFRSPDTTFLDPFSKSGVFLREIVKRLDHGLQDAIPDRQQRIDHILHRQVFGIAITELTAHLSRRTLYCSKDASGKYSVSHFYNPEGNLLYTPLRHTWGNNDKCIYCGVPRSMWERDTSLEQHAYQFIHTDNPNSLFKNMKFDVIIGNPPYQLTLGNEGGNSSKAKAIYHMFFSQSLLLNSRYVLMIMPSRWMTKTTEGISDDWVDGILKNNHFQIIHDFPDSDDCFPALAQPIKGGVMYFLWNSLYKGKTQYTYHFPNSDEVAYREDYLDSMKTGFVIRDPRAYAIVRKIVDVEGGYYIKDDTNFSSLVSPKDFFTNKETLTSSWKGYKKEKDSVHNVKYYISKSFNDVPFGWVSVGDISKNTQAIPLHKIYIPAAGGTGNDDKILGEPFYGEPDSVCSQTYLVIGYDVTNRKLTKIECENIITYIRTRFFRYLVSIKKKTQNGPRGVYQLVPLQDFSHPWTDEMLYKKYGLEQKEIDFIESMIRPME